MSVCVGRTLGTKNKLRNKQNVWRGGQGTAIYMIAEVYGQCSGHMFSVTGAWDWE